jgi:hypothetical protein
MAEESEEIMMYPYQLSKVLADQRIHDMLVAAERHELMGPARSRRGRLTELSSRRRVVTAQIARMTAILNGRRAARAAIADATMTSPSGAGPMGCSA